MTLFVWLVYNRKCKIQHIKTFLLNSNNRKCLSACKKNTQIKTFKCIIIGTETNDEENDHHDWTRLFECLHMMAIWTSFREQQLKEMTATYAAPHAEYPPE